MSFGNFAHLGHKHLEFAGEFLKDLAFSMVMTRTGSS
jgi:hypothetical protein